MTKKEMQKIIVKRFLTFVEEVFPQYEIDDYGDGGRIEFFPTNGTSDDIIEFQRSRLDLYVLNCANDQAKEDHMIMEGMLNVIIQEVQIQYESNQI